MSDLQVFDFTATGQSVRTVLVEGEPRFVGADVCAVLDLANPRSSLALLDDDERGVHTVDTPGGPQAMGVVSESGLYSLILRSRKPEARAFKRWITHEVLPALRRTGHYQTAPAFQVPQTMSEALRLAADLADRAETERAARLEAERQTAALVPSAAAWDHLGRDDGDWSVGDAAKILSRDPAIKTGRGRLFTILSEWGWTYRDRGDGHWRPYQTATDAGRLLVLPQSHCHPRTGDVVLDPPQVRITPKGLSEIHRRLGGTAPLAVQEQLALTGVTG